MPAISLPRGGGAIRGIGEKFSINPVNGAAARTFPLAIHSGRSGFGSEISLSYDSGAGSGPFGFGWNLSLPAITRKTEKGLPRYWDSDKSDVFVLSGAEDLVPVLTKANGEWQREMLPTRIFDGETYRVQRYRPRIEGLFSRVERWTNLQTGESHWRSITRGNITCGKNDNSRIFAAAQGSEPKREFSWLVSQSHDDKGNAPVYEYAAENDQKVDLTQANERNRSPSANRYLKRVKYGNKLSRVVCKRGTGMAPITTNSYSLHRPSSQGLSIFSTAPTWTETRGLGIRAAEQDFEAIGPTFHRIRTEKPHGNARKHFQIHRPDH